MKNSDTYPYWQSPLVQRLYNSQIPKQDTTRRRENQIPLQESVDWNNQNVTMILKPHQDSRRAGEADQETVGVGQPGYLFQRFYGSPVLADSKEGK